MRVTRLLFYCICFISVRCNVFSLSLSQPPGTSPSENLFLSEDLDPSDSNLLFGSDSNFDSEVSYSMELEPIIDNNNAFTANPTLLLSDASDECLGNFLPPSRRVRARADSDPNSCTTPAVNPAANLEGEIPVKMTTAEEIKNYWCAESNSPLPDFGNVPVCHELVGISGEAILQTVQGERGGIDRSAGFFQTLFNCALSMICFLFCFIFFQRKFLID